MKIFLTDRHYAYGGYFI